jgi:TonB family protein
MQMSRRAAVMAMSAHMLLFFLWLVARQLPQPPPPTRRVRLITVSELGAPPSITGATPPPSVSIAQAIAPPSVGLPEPVPDFLADVQTLATEEELSAIQTTDLSGIGEGDLQVVGDIGGTGQSDEAGNNFQPLGEELPVLLSMPRPVYPETARAADVSGTVILDILVDTDGSVKDVRIFKGHPMLNEAALVAARGAKFRPAKQGKMSVPVWVQFPMRFSLY